MASSDSSKENRPIAHTPITWDSDPHYLDEHLPDVGRRAERLAASFSGEAFARAAGFWHDLGKYGPDFQDYLLACWKAMRHGKRVAKQRIDHSSAGAQHAMRAWQGPAGKMLAYMISGHHAGLPDYPLNGWTGSGGESSLEHRLGLSERLDTAMAGAPPDHILNQPEPLSTPTGVSDLSFLTRMVFSTLIDSDRQDTEAFWAPKQAALRTGGHYDALTTIKDRLDAHLARLMKAAAAKDKAGGSSIGNRATINRLRKKLLKDCLKAAKLTPGLFSLTAPTGLGKTLAGAAFSLHHAVAHGKRRIIYVAPYTSIIEQTAAIFRTAMGSDNVLEHHSLFDPTKLNPVGQIDTDENAIDRELLWKLTVENWDAPVIVTTAVQFFESLFSAYPGPCRKLHNIANSVVFLDEAQLIPPGFLRPILRALRELMSAYGVTVVLSTATQPALDPRPTERFSGLVGPEGSRIEIVGGGKQPGETRTVNALHRQTRRFQVDVRDLTQPPTWNEVAAELANEESSLTIVNTRRSARDLYSLMPAGTIHLSALMCPAHRLHIINDVKARLRQETIRIISTQLIEAGVDLDFPLVYRALAGLDSLAQAGGRCNREGMLAFGRLVVFAAPDEKLPPSLTAPWDITRRLLSERPVDPFSPAMFDRYFHELFWSKGNNGLDTKEICRMLPKLNPDGIYFRTASHEFRLIDDYREDVIVRPPGDIDDPWAEEGRQIIDQLMVGPFAFDRDGWRNLLRRAGRYSVGINKGDFQAIDAQGGIKSPTGVPPGKINVLNGRFYHPVIGVVDRPAFMV